MNRLFGFQLLVACSFAFSFSCFAEGLIVAITHDAIDPERCMDLATDKKKIVFNKCSPANSQKWRIDSIDAAYTTIKNMDLPNDVCLFSTLSGENIEMQECKSGTYTSQTYWRLVTSGDEKYSLRSKVQQDYARSGWLSVNNDELTLNVEATPSGKWRFIDPPVNNTTAIFNKIAGQGQCMDLAPNKTAVVFNGCSGVGSQQWLVGRAGAYSTIKNSTLDNNICLFSSMDSKTIDMRRCDSGSYSSQTYWTVKLRGEETFSIISKVQNDLNKNGELYVNQNHALTLNDTSASTGSWSFSQYKPPMRSMKGVFNVLLLNTHFSNTPQRPTDEIRKALYGGKGPYSSLSEYLALASRGALTIQEGKTLDNLDIGPAGDTCNSTRYRDKAIELAKAQGVNPDDYDLVYVEYTANSLCSYVAIAILPSQLTKPGWYIVSNASGHKYWMWSHEFGHTLGFKHSNIFVSCPATATGVKIDNSCKVGGTDGGSNDLSDTMGGGGGKMYPVNYMYDVGWLTDEQFPIVSSGTYKIDPLLDDKGGKQGIRIKRNNPDFPYLMLEFRQANRFDSGWAANSPFINGVIVRAIRPDVLNSFNAIINTVPGSNDRNTPPLMVGKTLYDTYSGKIITVDSVGLSGAIVTVSDYIPPKDYSEWSASTLYTTVCQKVSYKGDTWVSGWETIGTQPGSDGEWGVWRKVSSDNVFDQCMPGVNPADDMEDAMADDL